MKLSASTKKVKKLLAVLDPYMGSWEEWTNSGACFLSCEDIRIIQNFLLTASHFPSSEELSISPSTAASRLNKIKLRLGWNYPKYQKWQTEKLLIDSGIITYSSRLDWFLNSPFDFLPIHPNLKNKLQMLLVDTMQDLFDNHSEAELRTYRNMGEKTIEEFKNCLIENNCLHLLTQ